MVDELQQERITSGSTPVNQEQPYSRWRITYMGQVKISWMFSSLFFLKEPVNILEPCFHIETGDEGKNPEPSGVYGGRYSGSTKMIMKNIYILNILLVV